MAVQTSIVIRTLNEGKHLEKVLQGIHRQNYRDWEIILVDSGSTDRTLDIARQYGANIHHIPAQEFTFGRSLNLGCREAQGDFLVFVSGHVWPVTNNWLGNLVEPFREPSVAMVYGRQRGTDASRLSELHDLQRQFGPVTQILVDEPKGNNGNAAIRKELWLHQPFDESLPGLEDVDWARKIERSGYRVYYAADASVYHLHEETLRQVYRRYLREAVASKRMFPHNRFTWSDVIRGLPYFILRDILFAFRQAKRGKIFQVPGNRIAQFLGMHQGMRYQKQLGRDLIRRLEIPDTYQRVVVDGPGRHGLQQAAIPHLKPGQILVQVAYANTFTGAIGKTNGQKGQEESVPSYPYIPGREFSGIVVKSGSNSGRFRKGQKVVGGGLNGWMNGVRSDIGGHGAPLGGQEAESGCDSGAYSQYLVVSSRHLRTLPVDVPLMQGALVGSLSFCLASLGSLGAMPGRSVCIVDAGPVANLCAQILRARGLDVTVVDPDNSRLALLEKYEINTLTQLGLLDEFDYLIEASGDSEVLHHLIQMSKPSAKVVSLGRPAFTSSNGSPSIPIGNPSGGKVINFPLGGQPADWRTAINLVRKRTVSLDDHTAVVKPLETYREALDRLDTREYFNVLLSASQDLEAL